jgi:hypothetical protein
MKIGKNLKSQLKQPVGKLKNRGQLKKVVGKLKKGWARDGTKWRDVPYRPVYSRDGTGQAWCFENHVPWNRPVFYFSHNIFNESSREPHCYTLQTLGRILKAENSKLWKWLEKMLRILLFAGTKTGPISEFWLLRDGTGRTAYGEKRQNPVGHGTGRNNAHLYCPVPNPGLITFLQVYLEVTSLLEILFFKWI